MPQTRTVTTFAAFHISAAMKLILPPIRTSLILAVSHTNLNRSNVSRRLGLVWESTCWKQHPADLPKMWDGLIPRMEVTVNWSPLLVIVTSHRRDAKDAEDDKKALTGRSLRLRWMQLAA